MVNMVDSWSETETDEDAMVDWLETDGDGELAHIGLLARTIEVPHYGTANACIWLPLAFYAEHADILSHDDGIWLTNLVVCRSYLLAGGVVTQLLDGVPIDDYDDDRWSVRDVLALNELLDDDDDESN